MKHISLMHIIQRLHSDRLEKISLFSFVFVLWFIIEFLLNTTVESIFGIPIGLINNVSNYLVLLLLLVQMAFAQTYNKNEFLIITFVSVFFLIGAAISHNFLMLSGWMFLIASKNTDFEKMVKIVYWILCILIPVIIVLSIGNVIEDFTKVRNGMMRHSLGFIHPNQLGERLFQLIVCHYYIHRHSLGIKDYVIAVVTALFVYLVPNSQSACMAILILTMVLAVYNGCRKYKKGLLPIYGRLLFTATVLCNALSVFLSVTDVTLNPILRRIDALLSHRFACSYQTLQIYGISWWGQKIYLLEEERVKAGISGAGRLYLDNSYMSLLISYGIVLYLLFSVAYLFLVNYFKRRNKYFIVTILFIFALYGIMENCLFALRYNIFLILFADALIYRKDSKTS